jgi:NADPH-dependent ferric siderophore reductase
VFAGEETASAAFGPMLRALGASARVYGVLESESPEHDVPLPGPHVLRRVHRHGAPAASSRILLEAVKELELPAEIGAAYVAGEAKTCLTIRDYLVNERGWPRAAIKVKAFWAPGKRGLH